MKEPIYLCGPTAVGKSAVALELARHLDREIVSVDSMQVYRGMDIGTAKPSAAERAGIRHHLIDVVDLSQTFDAAHFVSLAKQVGGSPIFCGGTGLYFNSLLHGLGEAPASDPTVRAALEAAPLAELLGELKRRDPKTWESIDRDNPRRVVRALEVIRLTGKPFSEQRAQWSSSEKQRLVIGLEMNRESLHQRINQRVDSMFAAGLVEETRELLKMGLRENRTAAQALGYKQVIEHLDGANSLSTTIELVKLRTRQFVKRQLTWFKRQLPCQWFDVSKAKSPGEIAEQLIDINKLV